GWSDIPGVISHVVAHPIAGLPAGFGLRFELLEEEDVTAVEQLIDQANHAEPIFDSAFRGTQEPLDPEIVQAELARLRSVAAERRGGAITPVTRGALLIDASQMKLQGAYHYARGEELRSRGRLEEACNASRGPWRSTRNTWMPSPPCAGAGTNAAAGSC